MADPQDRLIKELRNEVGDMARQVRMLQIPKNTSAVESTVTPSSGAMTWVANTDVSPPGYVLGTWVTLDLSAIVPANAVSAMLFMNITNSTLATRALQARLSSSSPTYTVYEETGQGNFSCQVEIPLADSKCEINLSGGVITYAIFIHAYRT